MSTEAVELNVLTSPVLAVQRVDEVAIELLPAAVEFRDAALTKAKDVTEITTPAGFAAVVELVKELRFLTKFAEDSRKQVKAPVLALGTKIDEEAKRFVGPVDAEMSRLKKLADAWEVEQARQRREAERLRQEEIRKAEAARLQAERDAAEAVRKANEAAAAAKAAEEHDPFAEAEAEAERERAQAQAKQRIEEANRQAAEAVRQVTVATAPAMAGGKTAGTRKVREPKFVVHDLLAFAMARPDLVTITPKTADIVAEMRKRQPWEGRLPIVQATCTGMAEDSPRFAAEGWWEERLVIA